MEIIEEIIRKVDSITECLVNGPTEGDVRDALVEIKELKSFLENSPIDFFTAVKIS